MRNLLSVAIVSTLLCSLATGLTACADKSVEDWKKEQLQRDLAKLGEASGSYSGILRRKGDGTTMGALRITLSPEVVARAGGSGNDNGRADAQAVLRAAIEFQAQQNLRITVPDGYFEPDTGHYQATFAVGSSGGQSTGGLGTSGAQSSAQRPNGAQEQLSLAARLQGDTFQGTMQAVSSPDFAADFTLTRNSGSPQQLVSSIPNFSVSGPADPRDSTIAKTLSGTTEFTRSGSKRSLKANLVILDPRSAPADEFMRLFTPMRTVQLNLSYGSDLNFLVSNVQWDQRTGTMSGISNADDPSGGFRIGMDCAWQGETHLSCKHLSGSDGVVAVSEFEAGPIGPINNSFGQGTGATIAKTLNGTTEFKRKGFERKLPMNLVVFDPKQSPAEELRRLFAPVGSVSVTLSYGGNLKLSMPVVKWDHQAERLSGSDPQGLSLDCQWSDATHMTCQHITAAEGVVAVSTLTEGPIADLQDPFGPTVGARQCSIKGTAKGLSKPGKSRIDLIYPAHTSTDDLMDLFFPQQTKPAQVSLDLFGDGSVVIGFPNTKHEPTLGTLEGSSSSASGNETYVFTLKCQNFDWSKPKPGFACQYFSNHLSAPVPIDYDLKTWTCGAL